MQIRARTCLRERLPTVPLLHVQPLKIRRSFVTGVRDFLAHSGAFKVQLLSKHLRHRRARPAPAPPPHRPVCSPQACVHFEPYIAMESRFGVTKVSSKMMGNNFYIEESCCEGKPSRLNMDFCAGLFRARNKNILLYSILNTLEVQVDAPEASCTHTWRTLGGTRGFLGGTAEACYKSSAIFRNGGVRFLANSCELNCSIIT